MLLEPPQVFVKAFSNQEAAVSLRSASAYVYKRSL